MALDVLNGSNLEQLALKGLSAPLGSRERCGIRVVFLPVSRRLRTTFEWSWYGICLCLGFAIRLGLDSRSCYLFCFPAYMKIKSLENFLHNPPNAQVNKRTHAQTSEQKQEHYLLVGAEHMYLDTACPVTLRHLVQRCYSHIWRTFSWTVIQSGN